MNSFSVGGVLSRSFSIWFKNLIPFTVLSALVYLPLLVYTFVALGGELSLTTLVQWTWVSAGLTFLLNLVATGAMTYGVFQQLRGQHASIGKCLGIGLARLGPVILVGVLVALCVGLGAILLVVPGVILFCMFYVSVPAAIIERPGITGAMKRSAELTSGYKWPIFGLALILGIIGWVVNKIAETVMIDSASTEPDVKAFMLVSVIISFVIGALQAVTNAVVYHDLRVAKEGVDADQLASVFD